MNRLTSPSLLILLALVISLLAPKGQTMTVEAPIDEPQSHCAQMMADNKVHKMDNSKQMECCDECECSMASCSNFLSLAVLDAMAAMNISTLPIINNFSIYLEPVQSLFKPPKIV